MGNPALVGQLTGISPPAAAGSGLRKVLTRRLALCRLGWLAGLLLLAACNPSPSLTEPPTPLSLTSLPEPASIPELPVTPSPTPFISPTPSVPASPSPLPSLTPSPPTSSVSPLVTTPSASFQKEIRFQPWELVLAVAWSPDGKLLAAAAGNQVVLLDGGSLEEKARIEMGLFTQALAFTPDGARLAGGGRDGLVRIWDLSVFPPSSQPSLVIQAHKKGVNSLAFSPDGHWLASGGNDAVARLWDASSGKLISQVIGGTFAVPGVAFAPGGGGLAIINGPLARLRTVEDGRIVGTIRTSTPQYSLAFSSDGKWLALGDSANTVRVWPADRAFAPGVESWPAQFILVGHRGRSGSAAGLVWRVAFSPGSDLLASAGGDGAVCLWSLADGKLLATLPAHPGGATSTAFSPDGQRLATAGLDGTLKIWGIR